MLTILCGKMNRPYNVYTMTLILIEKSLRELLREDMNPNIHIKCLRVVEL